MFMLPIFALLLNQPALAVETKEFAANGLTKVVVVNESGRVLVTADGKGKAQVIVDRKNFPPACQLTMERSDASSLEKQKEAQLIVKVIRKGVLPSGNCDADMVLHFPANLDVSVDTGGGDIEARGPFASFSFQVGSGSVKGRGPFGKMVGTAGSGNISLEKVNGGGELKTGSGEIQLNYGSKPGPVLLKIYAGSGSAQLTFPKGSLVKSKFSSGNGKDKNALSNPAAPFEVAMESGSGDLRIEAK